MPWNWGDDLLPALAASPWALAGLFALVLADALLVVVPGELAVTALGALAVATGSPPLGAVMVVAGAAALAGDLTCFWIGHATRLDEWRIARRPAVARAIAWARRGISERPATVVFTARFIPFARLAANLTAGGSHVPLRRYLPPVAIAAFAWAAYQAAIGAAVAAILPGGPLVAVLVSIACGLGLGLGLDAAMSAVRRHGARKNGARKNSASTDGAGKSSARKSAADEASAL